MMFTTEYRAANTVTRTVGLIKFASNTNTRLLYLSLSILITEKNLQNRGNAAALTI